MRTTDQPNKQTTNDDIAEYDSKKNLRDKVSLVLPDGLMIILAVIMVPIVVIPLAVELPKSVASSFIFADYTILGIFVIEYFLKAALARDIIKHVLNPWHLLDLLVIVLPLFDFLQLFTGIGRSSPILRLLRVARVVAVGSRALDRKMEKRPAIVKETSIQSPMEITIIDENLENVQKGASLQDAAKRYVSPSHTWTDFSSVSESNYDELSNFLSIPRMVLESELVEESYPRIDYFEHYSLIFARVPDVDILSKGARRLFINHAGILVICGGNNIVTISKEKSELFPQILERAKKFHDEEEPLVISVLFTILKHITEKDSQIISALEQQIMKLESIPLKERPHDFLEITFHLKKEVNQIVPSLLHMKEIASQLTSRRVQLEGFEGKHERLFDILADEAEYMHETAENARDNLLSLIDLYINTTSFELNKVMRVIAVITCLGIIPAVAGLFGSNLVGNPWAIELWQFFIGLAVAMICMAWVFYRLGWLK